MTTEGDEAPETSLSVRFDQGGVTAAAKSRFLAAVDAFLGNFAGLGDDWLKAKREQRRAHYQADQLALDAANAARAKILEAQIDQAVAAISGKSNPLLEQLLVEQACKADRLGGVLLSAQEAMPLLPPPVPSSSPGDDCPIDPDWLSFFRMYAERAASVDIQELWGRILAGEIRQPGSFGLSALRVMSELDRVDATAFEEVLAVTVGDWVLKPERVEGDELTKWSRLEEAGLLNDGGLGLTLEMKAKDAHKCHMRNGRGVLVIEMPAGQTMLTTSVSKLTAVGAQIAKSIPRDDFAPLRALAERIITQARTLYLGVITDELPDGRFRYALTETLKGEPA